MQKINQNGRSMIEMLGVLSIVGVLTVGGISLYVKALYQRKITASIDNVGELIVNIKNAYINRRDFSTLTFPQSRDKDTRNLVPEAMSWSSTSAIKDSLMYGCSFGKHNKSDKMFYVKCAIPDKIACVKLVSAEWGKGTYIGINEEPFDGGLDKMGTKVAEGKVSIGNANSWCQDNSSVFWVVKK